jgi:hypothetical protein
VASAAAAKEALQGKLVGALAAPQLAACNAPASSLSVFSYNSVQLRTSTLLIKFQPDRRARQAARIARAAEQVGLA